MVSPSKLGHRSDTLTGFNPTCPTLSMRIQGATTCSSGPGATATNLQLLSHSQEQMAVMCLEVSRPSAQIVVQHTYLS